MAKLSPLEVSAWIRKLGPSFKEVVIPYGLSCIFSYHQTKVDKPLLHAPANYCTPTWHVFQFSGVEICPTLEGFSAIIGEQPCLSYHGW